MVAKRRERAKTSRSERPRRRHLDDGSFVRLPPVTCSSPSYHQLAMPFIHDTGMFHNHHLPGFTVGTEMAGQVWGTLAPARVTQAFYTAQQAGQACFAMSAELELFLHKGPWHLVDFHCQIFLFQCLQQRHVHFHVLLVICLSIYDLEECPWWRVICAGELRLCPMFCTLIDTTEMQYINGIVYLIKGGPYPVMAMYIIILLLIYCMH